MIIIEKEKKNLKLLLITVCTILILICTAGITRATINYGKEINLTKVGSYNALSDAGLSDFEKLILEILFSKSELQLSDYVKGDSTYHIYIENLYKYYSSKKVDLSNAQVNQIAKKCKELILLMNQEGEIDFNKMSIDGRVIAINLAKQIYEESGLKLATNAEGIIKYIVDINGNDLYRENYTVQETNFHYKVFLISISAIVFLFGLIFFLVFRYQLFKRDVEYNGIVEEKYVHPITSAGRLN